MHLIAATHNWVLPDIFIICGCIGRQDRLGLAYLVQYIFIFVIIDLLVKWWTGQIIFGII